MQNNIDETKGQEISMVNPIDKSECKMAKYNERKRDIKSRERLSTALNILAAIFAVINGLSILPIVIMSFNHDTTSPLWLASIIVTGISSILLIPVFLRIDEYVIKRLETTLTEEQSHYILIGGCLSLLLMHLFLFALALIVPLEFFELRVDYTLPLSIILFILCLAIIAVTISSYAMAHKGKGFRSQRKIMSLLARLLFIANLILATLTIVDILIGVLVFIIY